MILEFKLKDDPGNWRAISTTLSGKYLVFVYAFYKKSQELQEKDKDVIRNRIRRIKL
jgi:phage-related protein